MLNSTLASPSLLAPGPAQWIYVTRRFLTSQRNLGLLPAEREDGAGKVRRVAACLDRAYWNGGSGNFLYAGSWAKKTAIRPPSDVDILYVLPVDVFHRFNTRLGNVQSQLLQEVRQILAASFPQTQMRGDGQVIVVAFNSITIEVVPAFLAQGSGFLICDTNNGGRWKHVHPAAEVDTIESADVGTNGNARKLTRIMKQWQRTCNVPIKGFHLEQLVREGLGDISYGGNSEFWFDWLVRDIFAYMIGRAGGGFFMPGPTTEWISLGDAWLSRAQSAYQRSLRACDYERSNYNILAGEEWQKIFGTMVPLQVT